MPIFRFVAIAGSLLLALLFVADATAEAARTAVHQQFRRIDRPEPVRTQTAQRAPEAPRSRKRHAAASRSGAGAKCGIAARSRRKAGRPADCRDCRSG